jgi:uncharacterized membrane protein YfbV (UPF0208 family)
MPVPVKAVPFELRLAPVAAELAVLWQLHPATALRAPVVRSVLRVVLVHRAPVAM